MNLIRDARMSALATDTACQVPEYAPFEQCRQVSLLAQCMTEQLYVRDSIVRALMYLQVRTSDPLYRALFCSYFMIPCPTKQARMRPPPGTGCGCLPAQSLFLALGCRAPNNG